MLAQKLGEDAFQSRHILKKPLGASELRALARELGGPEALVAPKRRAEAEGLTGEQLIAWLAGDGGRVRRPIIRARKGVVVGFNAESQVQLAKLLR